MLCVHLEGWDREGGREGDARGRRYGDICIHIADSLCSTAETNSFVKVLYYNKDVKKMYHKPKYKILNSKTLRMKHMQKSLEP